jgi:hypothetical protein
MADDLWNKINEENEAITAENEKLAPLLEEINWIQNEAIRNFTRAMMVNVEEFWKGPSSVSGKYHPPDEHGPGGDVLHTKRVIRITKILADSQERDDYERDILYSAALLHDITKLRRWNRGKVSSDPLHPLTVDVLFKKVRDSETENVEEQGSLTSELDYVTIAKILRLVRCHLGPWSPIPEIVPITPFEMTVHWADNIASHLHEVVDFLVPIEGT